MSNDDVLRLTLSGTPEDSIVVAIYQGTRGFDLRASALISLRQQGVSKPVIAAMLAGDSRHRPPAAAPVAPALPAAPIPTSMEPAHAAPPVGISPTAAVLPVSAPAAALSTFDLAAFRGARQLLISSDRIEFVSKDTQGRLLPDSFAATCGDLKERKPGRFERSLQLQLKTGRRYVFDVSKEVLVALMAALAEACGG